MNKAQLQKNVGSRVRLRPQATEALGAHDDDWTVRKVSDETFRAPDKPSAQSNSPQ